MPKSGTRTPDLPPPPKRSAQTSQSPSSVSGLRRGLGRVGDERTTRHKSKDQNQKGGERRKTNGSDGEEEEMERGMKKDFKNINNNGKKTNNKEKNKRAKRERSIEAQRHPRSSN
ncbi:hypothetical protein PBY51_004071 [Eleginops maclovinus]|uniref:Uncharacterized protein n=1 Tax=Eleginops maclovinus TaxID=56733 RepID=A0AAN7Y1C1_ELEMC|nr:hypothetical protein PBY51_004071 [Eleginops maclovinus]